MALGLRLVMCSFPTRNLLRNVYLVKNERWLTEGHAQFYNGYCGTEYLSLFKDQTVLTPGLEKNGVDITLNFREALKTLTRQL